MSSKTNNCKWAPYKGLWHTECSHFLTTADCGIPNYTYEEIPEDGRCPGCQREVVVIERKFGRKGKNP
jgi:hypothetical protein